MRTRGWTDGSYLPFQTYELGGDAVVLPDGPTFVAENAPS